MKADVFEWAASLAVPGDERLCPWSPNMRHSFLSHDDGTPGFISGNWECMYCGDPDR
jgi:hypothetical protein